MLGLLFCLAGAKAMSGHQNIPRLQHGLLIWSLIKLLIRLGRFELPKSLTQTMRLNRIWL